MLLPLKELAPALILPCTGDTSSDSIAGCQEVSQINPQRNQANYSANAPARDTLASAPGQAPAGAVMIPHHSLRLQPVKPQNIHSREQMSQS